MAKRPEPFTALDPEPKRIRELLDRTSDLVSEFLERLPSLPVDRPRTIDETRTLAAPEFPSEGWGDDELVAYLRELVFSASMYPGHPGFLAYIVGAGTAHGIVADVVAAAINQNAGDGASARARSSWSSTSRPGSCGGSGSPRARVASSRRAGRWRTSSG